MSQPADAHPVAKPAYGKINASQVLHDANSGKSGRQIAKALGVSHTAIQNLLAKHRQEIQQVREYKTTRAEHLARVQAKAIALQEQLIEDIAEDRLLGVMKPGQKAGILIALNSLHGTLYDKERLETGQSTANISTISKMMDAQVGSLYHRVGKTPRPSSQVVDEKSTDIIEKSE